MSENAPLDSNRHKHLDFIMQAISRMAQNSFVVRGWCVSILTALAAVAIERQSATLVLLGTLPVIAFWLLDAYYLGHERAFRSLYDDVRSRKEVEIDFDMSTLNYRGWTQSVKAFFSPVLLIVYGGLTLIIVATMVLEEFTI